MNEIILNTKKVAELREIARSFGITNVEKMKKKDIIEALSKTAQDTGKSAVNG